MSVWPESGEGAGATVGEDIVGVLEPESFLGELEASVGGGIGASCGNGGGPISGGVMSVEAEDE